MEGFEVCYAAGVNIEKKLNENLLEDNRELIRKYAANNQEITNIKCSILEDLKVRSLVVMQLE